MMDEFSMNFYAEITSKWSAIAGVQGTDIHVEIHLDDAERERISDLPYEEHCIEYQQALTPILDEAKNRVRALWKLHRRRKRK
jgi:hypothetical protein